LKRAVITGLGVVTALGTGIEATWQGLLDGKSGVGPIAAYDPSSLRTQIGGEASDFEPERFIPNRRTLRKMTRNDQLSQAGAALAVADAQLDFQSEDVDRVGLYIGGNKDNCDPMHLSEAVLMAVNEDGRADLERFGEAAQTAVYPLFYVEGLQHASLFYVSQAYGLRGISTYFSGTAESGAVAIGTAFRTVKRGEAEVVIAGGFDEPLSWWNMCNRFDSLGILTDRNDLGAAACRPYDRTRNGTVLGDGASFVVVEELEHAQRRNARIYAEVVGFGSAFDAYKLMTPHPGGRGLELAMRAALRESGSAPEAVDYIATHGSGTRLGDVSEVRAIQAAFGPAAKRLVAGSIKPATGHLMAAAGALNVAVAAMAVRDQVAPPMLNLDDPDPACDLDWATGQARRTAIGQALALARGLEGQNVALMLRAVA
jgi:3-oxoacyl-[acyl-carrier-protein] synthase II